MNRHLLLAALAAASSAVGAAGYLASRKRVRAAEKRSPAGGTFIEPEGVRLHVLQQGSGPDALLIHGAAMMASEMQLALDGALPGHRITAVDRPGHGYSDKRPRPSILDQARLIHAAAQELGLRRPVLVGHSLGGAVALAYADLFPDDVSGVVAIAPLAFPGWGVAHVGRAIRGAPLLGPLMSNTALALTDPYMLRGAMRLVFSPQKPTPEFRKAIDMDILSRPSAMVADGADFVRASIDLERLSRRYAALEAPLHVVVGESDHILKPSRQGERLAEAVPGARLTQLAGMGHMVHHFAPEAVSAAVHDVMARRKPAVTLPAAA